MGILDHLTSFRESCLQVNKQQLDLDMEQQTGSKLGKEYVKAVCCHLAYLTYMQIASCEISDWMKHKLESRLQGEIPVSSDTKMTPPLWLKVKKTKEPLDENEREESAKVDLKLNIQKTNIMASGPITSWEMDGETVEMVADFLFWAPKSLQMVIAAMKLKDTYFLERKL